MDKSKIIEIQNLSIAFKSENSENIAVKDLNLSINKGDIVGIVGESGSGKSVTALAIMRLLTSPPAITKDGKILFLKEDNTIVDLLGISEKKMQDIRGRHIGMVFQEPMTSLNPVYKCGLQVQEVILRHTKMSSKNAKEKVISLFEEVLLPDPERIYKAYPHEISGGQKQRVMIAMSMACNPSVIIADEPTTALDVTVQKTILKLFKSIREKYNITIIFITHDLGVIAEIADKVVVMYKGELVEENAVDKIFSSPQHPYTKGLLACRPNMKKRLRQLPVVSDFLNTDSEAVKNLSLISSDEISNDERAQEHRNIYSQQPILRVTELNKAFNMGSKFLSFKKKSFKALKDISFEVYPGETLGLVGESGCGKTTLGRSILRLIEPSSGKIFYKEQDVTSLSSTNLRKLRKEIQIIFQDPYSSLNPGLTVGNAITEPMKVHKIYPTAIQRKQKAIELLEKVGLNESHYNRYPHEFSGGQRQRIVIARTLSLNPKFIICDESVSALDVSIQAQVLNLLNTLKKEFGFTYIFISHDLSVVKFIADRIIIMKEGRIVEVNEADKLYASPQNEYTQKLIDSIPKGL